MDFWRSVSGIIRVRVQSADTASALSAIHNAGITLFDVISEDALTLSLSIHRKQFKQLKKLLEKRGEDVQLRRNYGIYWVGKGLLKRPVLLLGLLLILAASWLIPTRIWFFRVEGNASIPTKMILEAAENCGIGFGVSRREVRSEKMKNALLESLPQLQWAGINTSGCVATISVRERDQNQLQTIKKGVSSLVAARDGVILSCTVTKGTAVCKPGQAVKAGEILISGYTDCGLSIRACRAEGEIYARTDRKLEACTPLKYSQRGETLRVIKKYSLIIGKKRINFYKDSGILDSTCDKMYLENAIILPGAFTLPIKLVTEIWTYCESSPQIASADEQEDLLTEFAQRYLLEQTTAGEILHSRVTVQGEDDILYLYGNYACREMIGRIQSEEIIKPNGNYDGTNS